MACVILMCLLTSLRQDNQWIKASRRLVHSSDQQNLAVDCQVTDDQLLLMMERVVCIQHTPAYPVPNLHNTAGLQLKKKKVTDILLFMCVFQ